MVLFLGASPSVGSHGGKRNASAQELTVSFKQEWVRMFLAYVSNGAHQRDAIAELSLILVVVFLQHGFLHLGTQILLQVARCHHAVNHHV